MQDLINKVRPRIRGLTLFLNKFIAERRYIPVSIEINKVIQSGFVQRVKLPALGDSAFAQSGPLLYYHGVSRILNGSYPAVLGIV